MIERIVTSDRFMALFLIVLTLAPMEEAIRQWHWSPLLFYLPVLLIVGF